jgi:D-alanyl-lipoteichoic acid acyltransferase DltB (MBOAT superfamily)
MYTKEEYIHSKIIFLVYVIHIYIGLEFILAMVGAVARVFLGIELEPQFDEPYLASSLQDFWGKRWNLMVTSVLHPAVFNPVRSLFSRFMTKKWTLLPAAIASFLVSGIMHELIFYHIGRRKPTWEVTCFFLLHGVCLTIEIVIKRELNCSWGLPRVVAAPLVVGFVVATAVWLFMPTVVRCKIDVEARMEIIAFINFVKGVYIYLKNVL